MKGFATIRLARTSDKYAPFLISDDGKTLMCFPQQYWSNDSLQKAHLYVLSTDPITHGAPFMNVNTEFVDVYDESKHDRNGNDVDRTAHMRVLSATDTSLPTTRPSLDLIKAIADRWKSGLSTDGTVIVEYDVCGTQQNPTRLMKGFDAVSGEFEYGMRPKLDGEGQPLIHLTKESWTTEELVDKLYELLRATGSEIRADMKGIPNNPYIEYSGADLERWIDQHVRCEIPERK